MSMKSLATEELLGSSFLPNRKLKEYFKVSIQSVQKYTIHNSYHKISLRFKWHNAKDLAYEWEFRGTMTV